MSIIVGHPEPFYGTMGYPSLGKKAMEETTVKDKRFCECGCGELIDCVSYYSTYSRPKKFKLGHNPRPYKFPKGYDSGHRFKKGDNFGSKNWSWKGGKKISTQGYIEIRKEGHRDATKQGFYVLEHRIIWEEYNNASLLPWGHVHHINGNKRDNRIENLEAMMNRQHARLEAIMQWNNQNLIERKKEK